MSIPAQEQDHPGTISRLEPAADHGESTYRGSGRLTGKATLVTGADSGIGRAVAIAFAREGADVVLSYLAAEEDDARDTARLVEEAGRTAVLAPGDLTDREHTRSLVPLTVDRLGKLDVLVNNAAFQMMRTAIEDIPDDEWDQTLAVNMTAMFDLCKAAVPVLNSGASIINTTSVNSDQPPPGLLVYSATKAAIANFTGGLAQMLGPRGIRVNSVAPGPIWTPLIPATIPGDSVKAFGEQTPLGRAGQPAELAPVYVMLASDESSYVSGSRIGVTGGTPIL